jgi:hypothetical protein
MKDSKNDGQSAGAEPSAETKPQLIFLQPGMQPGETWDEMKKRLKRGLKEAVERQNKDRAPKES